MAHISLLRCGIIRAKHEPDAQKSTHARPSLKGISYTEETDMQLAIFVAIFAALFLPLLIILSGARWKAAEDKTRARRIADAKMNARLLRLNL